MSSGLKKYAPFFIAAAIGGGFLARKLAKDVPKIMRKMMPRMMEGMMGERGGPMDMCRRMMQGIDEAQRLATFATWEMRTLFEEWVKGMEASALEFVKDEGNADPQEIAARLGISLDSAVFLVNKLATQGKLKIGSVELAEQQ